MTTEAAKALSEEGPFKQSLDGFSPRASQQEMAESVSDVLEFGGKLIAESGTGTGKTFAYLVPILLSGKRTIISTGTKHLQDQIFHRDLPTVSNTLNLPVDAVLLKGRSNYLCRYRLRLNSGQSDLVGSSTNHSYNIIERWAIRTQTGDISEVGEIDEQAPVWKEVTSTVDNCLGRKCPDYKKCFVVKTREKAMDAQVVVVNHPLFFSDLNLKDDGFGELLPAYEAVVFDEAHALADIASNFFGFSVTSFQLRELCNDVVLSEKEDRSGVPFKESIVPLTNAIDTLQKSVKLFEGQSIELAKVVNNNFQRAIEALFIHLDSLQNQLELGATAGESLEKCYNRCCLVAHHLGLWSDGRDNNLVRWLNVTPRSFRLNATPLQISERFSELLGRARSWIFTSATLAIGNDFTAFSQQLGLDQAEHRQWASPFNFTDNSLLYLPTDMPDPRERNYSTRLIEIIREVTDASKGRTFCLFTSYAMLNQVYDALNRECNWPILKQGDAPRSELMDRFTQLDNAILLGTSSFWEGVDIKGEKLSCVIIDKLPFAAPSDPVLKSRLEACEEQGGNAFMDIQVPSAVIALKQGAGRLIRSEQDRGVLVLCDPRVTTKRYGKTFLNSLPAMLISRQMHDVETFFK